ncbi:ATP-dependent DNA ligase [Candidatus Dojkabacteria bacterium]|nr:ATP-dependent DNA ligase [Candidatus Dojkabacteria bacterium]
MKFKQFATILESLEKSSSRNEMTEILAGFLQKLEPDEIKPVMYMLTGRIAPRFIPLEFNFSTKLLLRAIEKASGKGILEIETLMAKKGDIGLVASEIKSQMPQKQEELSIGEVFQLLFELASLEGVGSQTAKIEVFERLFKGADPLSIKYVARMIVGKLRLGLNDKTILDSLSWAGFSDKSYRGQLDYAYGVRADIGDIAELVLQRKFKKLERIMVEPGTPVASKLVEREKSVEAVFERIPESIVQPKYDGLRLQIHYSRAGFDDIHQVHQNQAIGQKPPSLQFDLGKTESRKRDIVRIFSRNMEPLTDMFPDVVAEVEKKEDELPGSFVLDAEAIGTDPETGKYIPFQETIQRKRKYGIKEKSQSVPVKVYVFDILYLGKEDISQKPLLSRLDALKDLIKKNFSSSRILKLSESNELKDLKTLQKYFAKYLEDGLEGLIAKNPQSKYLPGTRNYDWIKLKANIDSKLIDTIDAVVLGYYHGRGARAKHGVGAFLVGVYNEKTEKFETIAKVGSGIKDEDWEGIMERIKGLEIEKIPENAEVKKELMPDVILRPEIVVVVEADEISKSKLHTAGQDKDGVGYSLRFPRLKEWDRADKDPEDVTKVSEVEKLLVN